jgi:hypothetical protein
MDLGDCEVRRVKLDKLVPSQYNPRKISDKAMDGLGHSIDRFGMLVPIVWNERSGNVVGGHQRLRHLQELEEKDTDVVVVNLDPTEEMALNIALNSSNLRGKFTKDVVGMLDRASSGIGEAFSDIGLDGLHDLVKRIKFDPGSNSGAGPGPSTGDGPNDGDGKSDANVVVTCPRCRSRWEMATGKVLRNDLEDEHKEQVEDSEDKPG